MYDLLIKNGAVIDGANNKTVIADIAIKGETIEKIGNLEKESAIKIIEAASLTVSPGFIDITNHSDTYLTLFTNPSQESLLRQGITTIIGGNCGSSLAPIISNFAWESIKKWSDVKKINPDWQTINEFFQILEKRGLPLNFGSLIGHSTLRRGLIGEETRNLKLKELLQIKKTLAQSLNDGAFGVSTGLVFSHSKSVRTEEIIELAEIVLKYNGLYATHIRDEGTEFIPAINETIRIAQETKVKTEISHLKVLNPYSKNFGEAIKIIENSNQTGSRINFDLYPYTATASPLHTLLPSFVLGGSREKILNNLENKKIIEELKQEIREKEEIIKTIKIASTETQKNFIGKTIEEIAKTQNLSIEETFILILKSTKLKIIGFIPHIDKQNVINGLKHKLSYVSTNGAGYSLNNLDKSEIIHPRSFGAFPKFWHNLTFDNNSLSKEEAIYKMSGGPATKLEIKNRGVIKKGYFADLIIFDNNNFKDLANFENPYQYAAGVKYLIINGKIVIDNGELINTKAGKIIRRK